MWTTRTFFVAEFTVPLASPTESTIAFPWWNNIHFKKRTQLYPPITPGVFSSDSDFSVCFQFIHLWFYILLYLYLRQQSYHQNWNRYYTQQLVERHNMLVSFYTSNMSLNCLIWIVVSFVISSIAFFSRLRQYKNKIIIDVTACGLPWRVKICFESINHCDSRYRAMVWYKFIQIM